MKIIYWIHGDPKPYLYKGSLKTWHEKVLKVHDEDPEHYILWKREKEPKKRSQRKSKEFTIF